MPRKPKHTIAELEAALEYFRSLTPGSSAAIYYEIIDRIVQNAINQRRASKDNPGRPTGFCECGHSKHDHPHIVCMVCPCAAYRPKAAKGREA